MKTKTERFWHFIAELSMRFMLLNGFLTMMTPGLLLHEKTYKSFWPSLILLMIFTIAWFWLLLTADRMEEKAAMQRLAAEQEGKKNI